MSLDLHNYFRSSSSYRVRIALNLKGLAYNYLPVHLNRNGGEQFTPVFRALSPNAVVPVLVAGEDNPGQVLQHAQVVERMNLACNGLTERAHEGAFRRQGRQQRRARLGFFEPFDDRQRLRQAALITAMLQIGGTFGTLVLGRVFDKVAPFRALSAIYCLGAGFIVAVGFAGTSTTALVVTIFGAGFCVVGGQIGANALAAKSYPTSIRATGVGWSLGIGRLGSVAGPVIGGMLLTMHWDMRQLFLVGAVPVFIAAIAALIISLTGADRRQAA